jgi:hypothetical protein
MPTLYQFKPMKRLTFSLCMPQCVILLRYVKRDGPVERFHSFVQVQNRTNLLFHITFINYLEACVLIVLIIQR